MFSKCNLRAQPNLIKHWRCSCPEIQRRLVIDDDTEMEDEALIQVGTMGICHSKQIHCIS
jgi:hypothetical protein